MQCIIKLAGGADPQERLRTKPFVLDPDNAGERKPLTFKALLFPASGRRIFYV